jgi:hypothetical protein
MTGHQKMFDKALSLAMVVFGGVISVPVQPVAGVVLEVVKTCHAVSLWSYHTLLHNY